MATGPGFGTGLQIYTVSSSSLSRAFEGLTPGTLHYAQVWTNSNNGLGSFTPVATFTTTGSSGGSGTSLWMKVSGVWKHGTLWMKVGGVWKQGVLWQKVGGTWKQGV